MKYELFVTYSNNNKAFVQLNSHIYSDSLICKIPKLHNGGLQNIISNENVAIHSSFTKGSL